MNIPKLQAVGSDLERTENIQQTLSQENPTLALEYTIKANQIILSALQQLMINVAGTEPIFRVIGSKVQEIQETLGEQRLSLQLLRLLQITNGSKSDAAEQLRVWLDENERY